MDPALTLGAAPSSGTRIVWIQRTRRARLAADARVALVVQRQQRNRVRPCVVPDILGGPGGERTHLAQHCAIRKREWFDLREIGARWGLLAAQCREPHIVLRERREQRSDLVARAAGVRILLPQSRRGLLSAQVHEIEVPALRDLIA